jgi:hypothetical protein
MSLRKFLPLALIACITQLCVVVATAQEFAPQPMRLPDSDVLRPLPPVDPQPVWPGGDVTAPTAALLDRLERAEARIRMLEVDRTSLIVEEVPETLFEKFADHLRDARDPEIAIAYMQAQPAAPSSPAKKWYEKIALRGYSQFRYNEVLTRDDDSAPPQHVGDRSVSENQTFFVRRARMIFYGDISEHMYLYIQPDLAVTPTGSPDANHFAQIRDVYADLYIDTDKVYRVRVGQSKVPFGWENMQSSSNRLPLDRSDSLNSAARNERDLGIFFYWTPRYAQDFFKDVMDEGLKGSGNYGMFGFGAYAGQGGSFQEQNDNVHFITRLTVPYQFEGGQRVEAAVQAYTGRYTVLSSPIRPLGMGAAAIRPAGTLETGNVRGIRDERIAWTGVWYPQPLGFQAEWNVGRGPGLNDSQTAVVERALYGGYAMTMYKLDTDCYGTLIPFARWNLYKGGYKPERNAPFSFIDEWELGLEWQFNPQMELVSMYTITDRTNTVAMSGPGEVSYRQFDGQLLRFQFQITY